MMDALTGWLRQVVAVVLLASLIDLLLPNRTMQRYVRLVAGMFILLTVAGPMLNWIKGDIGSQIAAGIEWAEGQPKPGADQLAQIDAEAKRLQASQGLQAETLVVTKLESQIRQAVEASEGKEVERVDVAASKTDAGTFQVLGVTVVMGQSDIQESDTSGSSHEDIKEVKPIAPVQIDILPASPDPTGDKGSASDGEAEPAFSVSLPEQNRIAALLAGQFGIDAAKVHVVVPESEPIQRK